MMKLLLFLFFFSQYLIADSSDQHCFVPGHCINSFLLHHTHEKDDVNCLQQCQKVENCEWFSYDPDFSVCLLFQNCSELSLDNCAGCTSGENECKSIFCWVSGECQGEYQDYDYSKTQEQCLKLCKDTMGCNWFTFDQGVCFLYENCPHINENCTTCISGQVECENNNQGLTKVLVANGAGPNSIVEAIDLSNPSRMCHMLPSYPWDNLNGAVGALVDNCFPLICGGQIGNNDRKSECFALQSAWIWNFFGNLTIPAQFATANFVEDDRLLILGGYYDRDTSQNVGVNGTVWPGPHLPNGVHGHCTVSIDNTTLMVIGGHTGTPIPTALSYFYDISTQTWSHGPRLSSERYFHSCGILRHGPNNFTVVVAGGLGKVNTAVEMWTNGAKDWVTGPKLPESLHGSVMVSHSQGVTLIGGEYSSGNLKGTNMVQLECANCEWQVLQQELQQARAHHVAFLVPDNLVYCE